MFLINKHLKNRFFLFTIFFWGLLGKIVIDFFLHFYNQIAQKFLKLQYSVLTLHGSGRHIHF